jgi:hypothetical protein
MLLLLQNIQDPLGASAIVAAGIFASVDILLRETVRMHIVLLAVMPRGERCTPLSSSNISLDD